MNLVNRWHNFSITKKLYSVFGIMAFLIGFELFILSFAMQTLSSVRALVEGEALWSKAQKDAINSLQSYIITEDIQYYANYQNKLKIPLGDRVAREELAKENPNFKKIYEGFIQGGVHFDDIDGIIKLLSRFQNFSFIHEAILAWQTADESIEEMIQYSSIIHSKINSNNFNKAAQRESIEKVRSLNNQLTQLEMKFSSTLGAGSRFIEDFLLAALLLIVITVEATGLIFTFRFGRRLSRELARLTSVATQIGKGDLTSRLEVQSQDELGILADALNNMTVELKNNVHRREEAEQLSRIKSLFLANMSHEIRTPLASIMGFTEIMEHDDISKEDRETYLGIIKNAGENLTDIINDILDISKVESGSLSLKKYEFSIIKLLNDIYNLLQLKCEEKGINFNFNLDPNLPELVETDPVRLRQILLNIISNSIKFTEKGSVSVFVYSTNDQLIFDVIDTGIGISQTAHQKIFEIFQQADTTHTRKYGGTGLGLPLSKQLALMLNGDLQLIQSKLGKGSHFQLNIKFRQTKKTVNDIANAYKSNDIDLSKLKVLVAEDNESIRMLLDEILKNVGCTVEFALDGLEAIKKIRQKNFDIVLMDIQMPNASGIDVVKKIRNEGITTPVIGLSAHAMEDNKNECLQAGFNGFISKPFKIDNLLSMLASFHQEIY